MKANVSNVYDKGGAPGVPQRNAVRAVGAVEAVEAVEAVGKPTPSKSKRSGNAGSAKWLIAGLLFLSFIPMAAAAGRLTQLTGERRSRPPMHASLPRLCL